MQSRTGPTRGKAGRGFTLIEVLLATILLLMLLGAIVFNFSSLEQGVRLDEGASQFEALLRFARAQATSSGRQVELVFEIDADPASFGALDRVRMTWEPDPLGSPGQFEDLPEGVSYLEHINDLVLVDSVRRIGPDASPVESSPTGTADAGEDTEELADQPHPIRFAPDGSSDSAEILLSSRDELDKRRVLIRLLGLTGQITKSVLDGGLSDTNSLEEAASPASSASSATRATKTTETRTINSSPSRDSRTTAAKTETAEPSAVREGKESSASSATNPKP
jgi:prepilin-type N-terminal cleavage/methylation domain-containing protein